MGAAPAVSVQPEASSTWKITHVPGGIDAIFTILKESQRKGKKTSMQIDVIVPDREQEGALSAFLEVDSIGADDSAPADARDLWKIRGTIKVGFSGPTKSGWIRYSNKDQTGLTTES